jgi:PAS domain S-box-containing protein
MSETRKGNDTASAQASYLRRQAEERLRTTGSEVQRMSPENAQRLVHELQVSQVELLVQNEELQRAQGELTAARDRYSNLYDFAPVGYVTLTPEGVILEANLTAAQLLGTERSRLIGTLLLQYITPKAHDTLFHHLHQLRAEGGPYICEVSMPQQAGPLTLQLESIAVPNEKGSPTRYQTILSDVTARKQTEVALQRLSRQLLEVQENERRHLARDLHDEIGQLLTALRLNLRQAQAEPQSNAALLTISVELVDQLIAQIRRLSLDLRPPILDDFGLIAALRGYVKRLTQGTNIEVQFSTNISEPRPHPLLETTCFRVAQEALTNVVRHAHAHSVHMDIRHEGDTLSLSIRDDGEGFDYQAAHTRASRGRSMGLLSMEERVRLAGGVFILVSTPGQGTEVKARFLWQPAEPVAQDAVPDTVPQPGETVTDPREAEGGDES